MIHRDREFCTNELLRMANETDDTKTQTPLVAALVGGAFALIGMLPLPYPYYTSMRLVIAGACAVMIGSAVQRKQNLAIAPLVFIAIFFLFVRGLPKGVWAALDFVAAVSLIGIGSWLATLRVMK